MEPIAIIFIVSASLFVLSLVGIILLPEYPRDYSFGAVVTAIVLGIVTFILGLSWVNVAQDNYNEETNRICTEQGGVVTKDNQCFRDNHPIEFSPGVWRR
jgi:hypothetical protein